MSSTPASHTPRKKKESQCDAKEGLPNAYITFNPEMLDDDKWTYRDLQKLAIKLNLGGFGNREKIIERLREWHKRQYNADRRSRGSNFSLLEVELPPSPKDENGKPVPQQGGVPPQLLSPLKTKPRRHVDGTPIGILSAKKGEFNPQNSAHKKSIKFSIFNGTKIIPPREAIQRRWCMEDGIDYETKYASDEEEEEEEEENNFNLANGSLASAAIMACGDEEGSGKTSPIGSDSSTLAESFADISMPTPVAATANNTPAISPSGFAPLPSTSRPSLLDTPRSAALSRLPSVSPATIASAVNALTPRSKQQQQQHQQQRSVPSLGQLDMDAAAEENENHQPPALFSPSVSKSMQMTAKQEQLMKQDPNAGAFTATINAISNTIASVARSSPFSRPAGSANTPMKTRSQIGSAFAATSASRENAQEDDSGLVESFRTLSV